MVKKRKSVIVLFWFGDGMGRVEEEHGGINK